VTDIVRAHGGLDAFVRDYAAGSIGDDEMTRFLRDVFENGLSPEHTYLLTMALVRSGETIAWRGLEHVVDKHSTGGVGDAVTLVAVPLAAACGARVAKLSGRALGHTGGTIDKLECVQGLTTDLTIPAFKEQVRGIGCAVSAATASIAPAEKKLYALRHRTATVASVPLIAASVMSKKIAAGAQAVVLDVKFGRGAFMESLEAAEALSAAMQEIGQRAGLRVEALMSSMDEPLADSVGDALELDEALSLMEGGRASGPLRAVALTVAETMLECADLPSAGVDRALESGAALTKFKEMVLAQGGRLESFDRTWPEPKHISTRQRGVVAGLETRALGEIVAEGKRRAGSSGASRVGIRMLRRLGSEVGAGEPVMAYWLPHGMDAADALVRTITIAPDAKDVAPLRVVRHRAVRGPAG
jgi:pyrimidine-nucleoside phosphorylase